MIRAVVKRTLIVATALALTAATNADEPPRLTHNPFARPPSEVAIPERPLMRSDGTLLPLELRATLVGENDKLANVAGKIIRPGDEVNGYTLLQVFENRAVFRNAGKRLTIYVKPDLEEDDE